MIPDRASARVLVAGVGNIFRSDDGFGSAAADELLTRPLEVASALARMGRNGVLADSQVAERIERLRDAPVERHLVAELLRPAWDRRHNVPLTDALYVQLAEQLDALVLTTDAALARAVPERIQHVIVPSSG